jgi:16S rRNA A1518/A1519 N6-dimethyltransferase RsmA/KsgA/DIM1 with predicted DNA glycosylase/AP lyase activity
VTVVQRRRAAFGQNLFVSPTHARRLVEHAGVSPGERVYDLGAGTGLITAALVEAGCRVVAVERDANLARKLRQRFAGTTDVAVVEADLADVAFRAPFKVVANPPFNVTADLMRRLLAGAPAPQAAAVVLQREAAEKYAGARPNAVWLSGRPWFDFEMSRPFRRSDFIPRPAVDVAMLRLLRRPRPDVGEEDAHAWRAFVRYGLARPRPDARRTFRGLVSNLQWRRLAKDLTIAPDAMREALTYEQWLGVFDFVRRCAPAAKLRRLQVDRDILAACQSRQEQL